MLDPLRIELTPHHLGLIILEADPSVLLDLNPEEVQEVLAQGEERKSKFNL